MGKCVIETPVDFRILDWPEIILDVGTYVSPVAARTDDNADVGPAWKCNAADHSEKTVGLGEDESEILKGADDGAQNKVRIVGFLQVDFNLLCLYFLPIYQCLKLYSLLLLVLQLRPHQTYRSKLIRDD